MSQLSRSNLKADKNNQFAANAGTGAISSANSRDAFENAIDSLISNVDDIQMQTTASGTDTYVASGGIASYVTGFTIFVKFTNANTGAATLNVNGLGAKAIKKSGTTALASGDISAGQILALQYDGTNFQVVGGGGGSVDLTSKADALITKRSISGNHTLDATDLAAIADGQTYLIEGDDTGDLTIPANATVAFTVGSILMARGFDVIVEAVGVTVTPDSGTLAIGAGATAAFEKTATNTWIAHNGSAAAVASVFGRTGVVTATAGDYTATQITNTPAGSIAATTAQAAINELDTEKAPLASPTFTGVVTEPNVLVTGQAAASGKKNITYIDDTGKIWKTTFVELDTTNQKTTHKGVDDLAATIQAEWQNNSGTWIMRVNNSYGVDFNGTSSFLEVQSGITDGNAGVIMLQSLDIAYRIKDAGSFDYLNFKSSTSGYGRATIIKQKQVNNEGAGFETIRRQFKLTLPNTTAAATHIVGSITVTSGYGLAVHVLRAMAFATNGNIQNCEPFSAIGKNNAGTTSGTSTTPTAVRLTATTGGFSVVWNDTTDTADISFTNETGTGRQYDVLVDVEYILYPIPV
jgi:hypothetical protein